MLCRRLQKRQGARRGDETMAEVVFIILVLAGAMALAMREAPLWLWALFAAAVVFTWQSDLLTGNFHSPDPGFLGLLAWLPAVVLGLLAVPSLRRSFLIEPLSARSRASSRGCPPPSRRRWTPAPSASMPSCSPASPIGRSCAPFRRITLTAEEKAFLDGPTQRAVPHGQRLEDPPQSDRRSPRRSGISSRSTASSACSSPRSTAASASRRRRSR